MRSERLRSLLIFLLLNGGLLACALVYRALYLHTGGRFGIFGCVFQSAFSLYCPGCGASRALLSLLALRPLCALYYSPAMVVGALLFLDYDVRLVLSFVRGDASARRSFRLWLLLIFAGVLLLTCLVRNVLWLGFGIDVLGDLSGGEAVAWIRCFTERSRAAGCPVLSALRERFTL